MKIIAWTLLFACSLVGPAEPLRAADQLDDTTESAIFLIEQGLTITRTGRHHTMLLALRHLGDPELTPLFSFLADAPQPVLKVHGLLGMADCHPDKQLDLVRLAKLDKPALQAEIVSAAMAADMLSDEQALQIYNWPDLDDGVRVVVAMQLLQHGKLKDKAPLHQALASDNEARRALVGLILHQLGDPAGMVELRELDASDSLRRDEIREMLLQSALRYELDRAGPWAVNIATEPGSTRRLSLMATQVAMRFGIVEAMRVWQQQYASATDPAQRIRLALAALRLSNDLDPSLFDPLVASADPLVAAIGNAGRAVAAKKDIARQVVNLVQQNHPIGNDWALRYAQRDADPQDAVRILVSVILAFDHARPNKAQLLDDAVTATQVLHDLDPTMAAALLRPIFEDAKTHPELIKGMLMGLIRSRTGDAAAVIDGLGDMRSVTGNAMAVVLRGKSTRPMDDRALAELALVVRGGSQLDAELRVQAGWAYLKRTGQTKLALARVMSR